jgi:hypothetical protein
MEKSQQKHNSELVCVGPARDLCAKEWKKASQRKTTSARANGKRSLVTDENRPKMKSSVQIVCAIGEWNFKFSPGSRSYAMTLDDKVKPSG